MATEIIKAPLIGSEKHKEDVKRTHAKLTGDNASEEAQKIFSFLLTAKDKDDLKDKMKEKGLCNLEDLYLVIAANINVSDLAHRKLLYLILENFSKAMLGTVGDIENMLETAVADGIGETPYLNAKKVEEQRNRWKEYFEGKPTDNEKIAQLKVIRNLALVFKKHATEFLHACPHAAKRLRSDTLDALAKKNLEVAIYILENSELNRYTHAKPNLYYAAHPYSLRLAKWIVTPRVIPSKSGDQFENAREISVESEIGDIDIELEKIKSIDELQQLSKSVDEEIEKLAGELERLENHLDLLQRETRLSRESEESTEAHLPTELAAVREALRKIDPEKKQQTPLNISIAIKEKKEGLEKQEQIRRKLVPKLHDLNRDRFAMLRDKRVSADRSFDKAGFYTELLTPKDGFISEEVCWSNVETIIADGRKYLDLTTREHVIAMFALASEKEERSRADQSKLEQLAQQRIYKLFYYFLHHSPRVLFDSGLLQQAAGATKNSKPSTAEEKAIENLRREIFDNHFLAYFEAYPKSRVLSSNPELFQKLYLQDHGERLVALLEEKDQKRHIIQDPVKLLIKQYDQSLVKKKDEPPKRLFRADHLLQVTAVLIDRFGNNKKELEEFLKHKKGDTLSILKELRTAVIVLINKDNRTIAENKLLLKLLSNDVIRGLLNLTAGEAYKWITTSKDLANPQKLDSDVCRVVANDRKLIEELRKEKSNVDVKQSDITEYLSNQNEHLKAAFTISKGVSDLRDKLLVNKDGRAIESFCKKYVSSHTALDVDQAVCAMIASNPQYWKSIEVPKTNWFGLARPTEDVQAEEIALKKLSPFFKAKIEGRTLAQIALDGEQNGLPSGVNEVEVLVDAIVASATQEELFRLYIKYCNNIDTSSPEAPLSEDLPSETPLTSAFRSSVKNRLIREFRESESTLIKCVEEMKIDKTLLSSKDSLIIEVIISSAQFANIVLEDANIHDKRIHSSLLAAIWGSKNIWPGLTARACLTLLTLRVIPVAPIPYYDFVPAEKLSEIFDAAEKKDIDKHKKLFERMLSTEDFAKSLTKERLDRLFDEQGEFFAEGVDKLFAGNNNANLLFELPDDRAKAILAKNPIIIDALLKLEDINKEKLNKLIQWGCFEKLNDAQGREFYTKYPQLVRDVFLDTESKIVNAESWVRNFSLFKQCFNMSIRESVRSADEVAFINNLHALSAEIIFRLFFIGKEIPKELETYFSKELFFKLFSLMDFNLIAEKNVALLKPYLDSEPLSVAQLLRLLRCPSYADIVAKALEDMSLVVSLLNEAGDDEKIFDELKDKIKPVLDDKAVFGLKKSALLQLKKLFPEAFKFGAEIKSASETNPALLHCRMKNEDLTKEDDYLVAYGFENHFNYFEVNLESAELTWLWEQKLVASEIKQKILASDKLAEKLADSSYKFMPDEIKIILQLLSVGQGSIFISAESMEQKRFESIVKSFNTQLAEYLTDMQLNAFSSVLAGVFNNEKAWVRGKQGKNESIFAVFNDLSNLIKLAKVSKPVRDVVFADNKNDPENMRVIAAAFDIFSDQTVALETIKDAELRKVFYVNLGADELQILISSATDAELVTELMKHSVEMGVKLKAISRANKHAAEVIIKDKDLFKILIAEVETPEDVLDVLPLDALIHPELKDHLYGKSLEKRQAAEAPQEKSSPRSSPTLQKSNLQQTDDLLTSIKAASKLETAKAMEVLGVIDIAKAAKEKPETIALLKNLSLSGYHREVALLTLSLRDKLAEGDELKTKLNAIIDSEFIKDILRDKDFCLEFAKQDEANKQCIRNLCRDASTAKLVFYYPWLANLFKFDELVDLGRTAGFGNTDNEVATYLLAQPQFALVLQSHSDALQQITAEPRKFTPPASPLRDDVSSPARVTAILQAARSASATPRPKSAPASGTTTPEREREQTLSAVSPAFERRLRELEPGSSARGKVAFHKIATDESLGDWLARPRQPEPEPLEEPGAGRKLKSPSLSKKDS